MSGGDRQAGGQAGAKPGTRGGENGGGSIGWEMGVGTVAAAMHVASATPSGDALLERASHGKRGTGEARSSTRGAEGAVRSKRGTGEGCREGTQAMGALWGAVAEGQQGAGGLKIGRDRWHNTTETKRDSWVIGRGRHGRKGGPCHMRQGGQGNGKERKEQCDKGGAYKQRGGRGTALPAVKE